MQKNVTANDARPARQGITANESSNNLTAYGVTEWNRDRRTSRIVPVGAVDTQRRPKGFS
jgi:hypothetical protein